MACDAAWASALDSPWGAGAGNGAENAAFACAFAGTACDAAQIFAVNFISIVKLHIFQILPDVLTIIASDGDV